MKSSTLLFPAALALASAASSFGQVITTFETLSLWNGSSQLTFASNTAISQTMQLPEETPAIYSMTWRFTTAGNVTGNSTLEAYFAEWNPATNRPVGAALWSNTSLSIPAYGTGTFDLVLKPNLLTDPTKTYAMILRGVSVASNVQAVVVDEVDGDNFVYGENFRRGSGVTSFTALTGLNSSYASGDWGFSQIILTDAVTNTIPETGTVAVVFAGALVAGLGLRRRRRDTSVLPMAAA